MRWILAFLGAALSAVSLFWALVTTGHWPLDDRTQPATAVYALNDALGRWLFDHGGAIPHGGGGPVMAAPAAEGLTAAEIEAVQRTLGTDPRFRDRHRFTLVPKTGPTGRG